MKLRLSFDITFEVTVLLIDCSVSGVDCTPEARRVNVDIMALINA